MSRHNKIEKNISLDDRTRTHTSLSTCRRAVTHRNVRIIHRNYKYRGKIDAIYFRACRSNQREARTQVDPARPRLISSPRMDVQTVRTSILRICESFLNAKESVFTLEELLKHAQSYASRQQYDWNQFMLTALTDAHGCLVSRWFCACIGHSNSTVDCIRPARATIVVKGFVTLTGKCLLPSTDSDRWKINRKQLLKCVQLLFPHERVHETLECLLEACVGGSETGCVFNYVLKSLLYQVNPLVGIIGLQAHARRRCTMAGLNLQSTAAVTLQDQFRDQNNRAQKMCSPRQLGNAASSEVISEASLPGAAVKDLAPENAAQAKMISHLKTVLSQREEEIKMLQNERDQLRNEIKHLESEARCQLHVSKQQLQDTTTAMQRRLDESRDELDASRRGNEALQSSLDRAVHDSGVLKRTCLAVCRWNIFTRNLVLARWNLAQHHCGMLQEDLSANLARYERIAVENVDLQQAAFSDAIQIEELTGRLADSEDAVENLSLDNNQKEKKLREAESKIEELQAVIDGQQQTVDTAVADSKHAEAELQFAMARLHASELRRAEIESTFSCLARPSQRVRRQMMRLQKAISHTNLKPTQQELAEFDPSISVSHMGILRDFMPRGRIRKQKQFASMRRSRSTAKPLLTRDEVATALNIWKATPSSPASVDEPIMVAAVGCDHVFERRLWDCLNPKIVSSYPSVPAAHRALHRLVNQEHVPSWDVVFIARHPASIGVQQLMRSLRSAGIPIIALLTHPERDTPSTIGVEACLHPAATGSEIAKCVHSIVGGEHHLLSSDANTVKPALAAKLKGEVRLPFVNGNGRG